MLPNALPPQAYRTPSVIALGGVAGWAAWRLWRFTVAPWLHPDAPRELPYWIPFIGHGISFFTGAAAVLARGKAYFGHTKELFAITVFGSTMYIVTHPDHITQVYKNTENLSFEIFVKGIMKSNGMSDDGLDALYSPQPREKIGFPNPHATSLGTFVREMNKHQLYPGVNLDQLDTGFLTWFDKELRLPALLQNSSASEIARIDDNTIEVPLMQWCGELIVQAAGTAYFGESLNELNPNLSKSFLIFNKLGWQILYQYPSFLTKTLAAARKDVHQTLKGYFRIPQGERQGDAWVSKAMEDELKQLDVDEDDMAVFFLNFYWAINTNTRKAAFWMLAYMLHTPTLIESIRKETSPAFTGDQISDLEYLCNQCSQLESIWLETLRLNSNAASVRLVTKDTIIGNKVMCKGNRIMIPYRLLHFDEDVYGGETQHFKPERFAGEETRKRLARGQSWKPFGGGRTLCPGRFTAKNTVFMFIAILLRRFDLTTLEGSSIPEADLGRPVLGLMSTLPGEDLQVRLRHRTAG